MKNISSCERVRCCELRSENLISCEDCIIKDECKESDKHKGVNQND